MEGIDMEALLTAAGQKPHRYSCLEYPRLPTANSPIFEWINGSTRSVTAMPISRNTPAWGAGEVNQVQSIEFRSTEFRSAEFSEEGI